jgi:hypothetical protein
VVEEIQLKEAIEKFRLIPEKNEIKVASPGAIGLSTDMVKKTT